MSNIATLLKSVQAIYTDDHFVYTSGKHGSVYINKDSLYPYSQTTSEVCRELALACTHLDIETVVAPALGGIILSQWLSFHLSELKQKTIYGVYAEKDPVKDFILSRGYDKYVTGHKVLVVEDLTTTGGSVAKVVKRVREYGGEVVGVCVMVNRNPEEVTAAMFDAPLIVGAEIAATAWDPKDCPLCEQKVPINLTMGHGKKFKLG